MPHDAKNEIVKEGDIVYVPCIVKAVHTSEEYCNVSLETIHPMPPYTVPSSITLNTRQVVKKLEF
jgi:hypothetical protein